MKTAHRRIEGSGTSEQSWAGQGRFTALPAVSPRMLVPTGSRLVICAPHPDDEILPCGGLLALLPDREIVILALTDGEASHSEKREFLRKVRPEETSKALAQLGVNARIRRFRLPDGQVEQHAAKLREKLAGTFLGSDIVLTPWALDGHPDHEAVTRLAREAASLCGAAPPIECPIWGWHWATPDEEDFPWAQAVRLNLPPEIRQRKRRALRAFSTQITAAPGRPAILSPITLRRFDRPWEIFFRTSCS